MEGTGWEKDGKAEKERGFGERWEEAQGGAGEPAGAGSTCEKIAGGVGGVAKSAHVFIFTFQKSPSDSPHLKLLPPAFALVPSHHKVIPSQGPHPALGISES